MFLVHTQRRTKVGRTPLDEWSARRRDLYLTAHNTHNRETSIPPVRFEPTISAGERPQTYALDRAATGTGCFTYSCSENENNVTAPNDAFPKRTVLASCMSHVTANRSAWRKENTCIPRCRWKDNLKCILRNWDVRVWSGFKWMSIKPSYGAAAKKRINDGVSWKHGVVNLMFVDPCIIGQFIKKSPTKCNNVSKFCYSIFIWSSTCFGRHTAHHQEPRTVLAASGFSYVEGCWTCSWWTLSDTYSAWQCPPTTRPTAFHVWKTRGCQCSFRLLIMGDVSPETCWALYKYGIIKFWYIVAYCWTFLYEGSCK